MPLGSLCLTYCPHTLSLYSTQHPWDRRQKQELSPTSSSAPWHGQQMLALPFQQRNTKLPTGTGSCCLPASGIVEKEYFGVKGLLWAP